MNFGWRNFLKQRVRFRENGEGIREESWLNTDLKKECCFMKREKKASIRNQTLVHSTAAR